MESNNSVFLLDIDGTLNEPQQPISEEMHGLLQRLARHHQVYFVTGNTYTKSVDMLNGHIKEFAGVFCSTADELRTMRGKLIWQDTVIPPIPADIEQTLYTMLLARGYSHSGNRIEWRNPRNINFSVIGRNATMEQRAAHDPSWRQEAMDYITHRYPEIDAAIGGSISIDICSHGADKSRACKYINGLNKDFIFIGDKTSPGGNDYPVKTYCELNPKNICLTTSGPKHTMEMLNNYLR